MWLHVIVSSLLWCSFLLHEETEIFPALPKPDMPKPQKGPRQNLHLTKTGTKDGKTSLLKHKDGKTH